MTAITSTDSVHSLEKVHKLLVNEWDQQACIIHKEVQENNKPSQSVGSHVAENCCTIA